MHGFHRRSLSVPCISAMSQRTSFASASGFATRSSVPAHPRPSSASSHPARPGSASRSDSDSNLPTHPRLRSSTQGAHSRRRHSRRHSIATSFTEERRVTTEASSRRCHSTSLVMSYPAHSMTPPHSVKCMRIMCSEVSWLRRALSIPADLVRLLRSLKMLLIIVVAVVRTGYDQLIRCGMFQERRAARGIIVWRGEGLEVVIHDSLSFPALCAAAA